MKIIDPMTYKELSFFTTTDVNLAAEQYFAIYNNSKMILERKIKLFLISDGKVNVYLINVTRFSPPKWALVQEVTIHSWFNTTTVNEEFNENLTYFPALIIYNPTDYPITYNFTVSQEMLILHPNYNIAFKSFWMAVISFFILIILGVYLKVGPFILTLKILTYFPLSKYRDFIKEEYESGKHYLPFELIIIGIIGSIVGIFFLIAITRVPRLLYGYSLNMVRNYIYYGTLFLLICFSFLLFIFYILCGLLIGLFLIPRYSAFKDFNDFKLYEEKTVQVVRRIIKKCLIIFFFFIPFFISIIGLLSKYSFNLNLFSLLLFLSLSPLLIAFSYITAREVTSSIYINPFKEALLMKFAICGGGFGGIGGIFIGFLIAYYLFPWRYMAQQQPLQGPPFISVILQIQEDVSVFLCIFLVLPISLLVFYLSFCLFITNYISTEDREILKREHIRTPILTSILSFFLGMFYNIMMKFLELSGDPLERIANAVLTVFNVNSLVFSALVSSAITLLKDYCTLTKLMEQLKNK
jgi:hypothetical protein